MVTGIRNKFAEGTVSNFGDVFGNFESQNANYRNVQEQNKVAKAQTQAEQIKQKNLQTAWKIGMTHNLTPEQFQNELVLANVHNTPEGKGALEQYSKIVAEPQKKSADLQGRIDTLFGPVTKAAFAKGKEGEQQYNTLPVEQRDLEVARDKAQGLVLQATPTTTMDNVEQQYADTLKAGDEAAAKVPTGIQYRAPTGQEERTLSIGQQVVSGAPMGEVQKDLSDAAKQEQLLGNKKELAEMQYVNKDKLQTSKQVPAGKAATAGGAGQVYNEQDNPIEYGIAKKLAYGEINFSQAISIYPSFGQKGQKRENIIATAMKINPSFAPSSQMIAFGSQRAAGSKDAGVQQQKVAAANSIQTILNSAKGADGEFVDDAKMITPQFATELAMGAARLISPNGQIAESLVNELSQKTAKEKVSRAMAWLGIQEAGTTKLNLQNIQHFVDREGSLAQRQRDIEFSGHPAGIQFPGTAQSPAATKGQKTYTPNQARGLPKDTRFMGTDGKMHKKL